MDLIHDDDHNDDHIGIDWYGNDDAGRVTMMIDGCQYVNDQDHDLSSGSVSVTVMGCRCS
jgi:hypothetical protein